MSNNKSLDRMPIDDPGQERPGLYVETDLHLGDMTVDTYVSDHDGAWKNKVFDIKPADWIPCVVAAHLGGISKQAISDRIRRGTLQARETFRASWYGGKGAKVVLVRLGDVQKKKKAGRPKGSRNKQNDNPEKIKRDTKRGFPLIKNKTYWIIPLCGPYPDEWTKAKYSYSDLFYDYFRSCDGKNTLHSAIRIRQDNPNKPKATYTNWNGMAPQIKLIPGKPYLIKPKDGPDEWVKGIFNHASNWYYFRIDGRGMVPVKDSGIRSIENP